MASELRAIVAAITPRSVEVGSAEIPLEGLFRAEAPRLLRFFRRRGAHHEDASDLVQEAFSRLVGVQSKSVIANPRAYLQRIARNLLFNRAKRLEARLSSEHIPFDERDVAPTPAAQELELHARDLLERYRAAVDSLPERTRRIFLMHRVDELSYRLIAEHFGIALTTVEYHVARALVHLERMLRDA